MFEKTYVSFDIIKICSSFDQKAIGSQMSGCRAVSLLFLRPSEAEESSH